MTAKKTLTPAQKKIAACDRQRKTADKKSGEKLFRDSLLNFKNPVGIEVDMGDIEPDASGPGKVVFYDKTNDAYLIVYPMDDGEYSETYWANMSELELPKPPVSITVTVPACKVNELEELVKELNGK